MLTVYRRHSPDCQHFGKPRNGRGARGCACPIWVQGSLRGEYIRKALNLTSWEAAADVVRGWDASGEIGVVKPDVPAIADAISRFFEGATARGLKPATIGKYKVLIEKQLLPWCRSKGYTRLRQLGVDELTRFRATWPDAPLSMQKKQERLAAFFHFCRVRLWVSTNPILSIKLPEVPSSPTLPFTRAEMKKILAGCDEFPIKGVYGEGKGHFHMLRDTAAVECLIGGVPLETVSVLLGHKDVRTTLEHYPPWVDRLQRTLEDEVRRSWDEKATGANAEPSRHRKTRSRSTPISVPAICGVA